MTANGFRALQTISKGGGGAITFASLREETLRDFPYHPDLANGYPNHPKPGDTIKVEPIRTVASPTLSFPLILQL